MLTVNAKDAKAGLSGLVDRAVKGEFVPITRRGKPVAALVSVAAADIACKVMEKKRPGLVAYLRTFPGEGFERNGTPSRTLDLCVSPAGQTRRPVVDAQACEFAAPGAAPKASKLNR